MAKSTPHSPLQSMTGFASVEKKWGGRSLRVEMRSLNHRFLDLKVKLPREISPLEHFVRQEVPKHFVRGAIELKIEILTPPSATLAEVQPNLALAAHYYECLITLQKTLGLNDPIRTRDLLSFPDVMARESTKETVDTTPETLWKELKPYLHDAFEELKSARVKEGSALADALETRIHSITKSLEKVKKLQDGSLKKRRENIREQVEKVFDAYSIKDQSIQSVMESRIAQELALALERADVEEEFTRLENHLNHFTESMAKGSSIGRQLDFILQEMGREINTLGNKSLDYEVSENVVQMKVVLEQLREQCMNVD